MKIKNINNESKKRYRGIPLYMPVFFLDIYILQRFVRLQPPHIFKNTRGVEGIDYG